jgi:DNA polymerase-1
MGAKKVYLDLETTSGDDEETSLSPWQFCDILGICITVDSFPDAVYIPLRHQFPNAKYSNFPIENAYAWLKDIMVEADEWINHNIKYDAHVLYNCTDIRWSCKLCDTLTRAKLIDSDRFRYNLTSLMNEWLFKDVSPYETRLKSHLGTFKDYGIVPIDIVAEYGGIDSLSVRDLNDYCEQKMHSECKRVWDLETKITPILFNIENVGMRIDKERVGIDVVAIPTALGKMRARLREESGISNFKPNVNAHCEALLCGTHGLPVLERTPKEKNASFSSKALEGYSNRPDAPKNLVEILGKWKKYHKLYTSFTMPYTRFIDSNGYMHPDYNQIVSTGRMSCKQPNAQQLSKLAKEYIIPPDGYAIIDVDFSQIEFRVIVHYANDKRCIEAYKNDPSTDFHKWVQTMCNLERSQAKTLNFRLGYGGGKSTTALALTTTENFVQEGEAIEEAIARGEEIYDNYYTQLPTLKSTRWRASAILKDRGFCRTILGRHRHLDNRFAFKAFNTACQGTAADLMKDATVRLAQYLSDKPDVVLWGLVHDSWCLYAPIEIAEQIAKEIVTIVEEIPSGINFRVPIKADYGISTTNWRQCDE